MPRRFVLPLTGLAVLLVLVGFVVAVVRARDDDGGDEGASGPVGHERLRGVFLVSSEDAFLRGPWDGCRDVPTSDYQPGKTLTILGPQGEELGGTTLRNVSSRDMERLAALLAAYPDRDEDVGFTGGNPANLERELRRTEHVNCLLQWSVRVDRAESYTLRFGDTELDPVAHSELVTHGFFIEHYYGP